MNKWESLEYWVFFIIIVIIFASLGWPLIFHFSPKPVSSLTKTWARVESLETKMATSFATASIDTITIHLLLSFVVLACSIWIWIWFWIVELNFFLTSLLCVLITWPLIIQGSINHHFSTLYSIIWCNCDVLF